MTAIIKKSEQVLVYSQNEQSNVIGLVTTLDVHVPTKHYCYRGKPITNQSLFNNKRRFRKLQIAKIWRG